MRPSILNPLFAPVTSIAGIGPRISAALSRLLTGGGEKEVAHVADLLFHLPSGVLDRRSRPLIMDAHEGQLVTLEVRVDRHQPPPRGNRRVPYKVLVHDESGELALTFFNGNRSWLEGQLPVGEIRFVSGRLEWFNGRATMVHPDYMVSADDLDALPAIEPVYPLAAGVSGKILGKAIRTALELLPNLPEWQDKALIERENWPSFREALHHLHRPSEPMDVAENSPAWRRLAFDELLAGQLALALVRSRMKRTAGKSWRGTGKLQQRIRDSLPFDLTGAQERSVAEIVGDMALPERMLRLLQGDVGSGKTIVALLAAAAAVEAGGQAAILAPTEVLARQHFATIAPLAEKAGLRTEILTGREKGAAREALYTRLRDGEIDLLIGTHAVFQSGVEFADLALGIVDEQHRFGVHQRLALAAKGRATDILVMTATPIPRTLVLSHYGDMDVSRLDEKPANRLPIRTNAIALERLDELVGRVRDAVAQGEKIYWICPLVEESDELPVTSAQARHKMLKELLGDQVGLVHGRLKTAEKDSAMAAFKNGDTRVLVATTVVEVGVDIPDATIMVIEHAERFGVAQLHQLRGRVGRGDKPSSCILLYKSPLGEVARARLNIMRETEDGFRIAEEDLRLRGEGEILGTRQSGMPGFNIARMEHHADLLQTARDSARLVLAREPELDGDHGDALRALLYLFSRDEAVRLLRAG